MILLRKKFEPLFRTVKKTKFTLKKVAPSRRPEKRLSQKPIVKGHLS